MFNNDGKFWIKTEGEVKLVGLTADYLASIGVIWVIVPRKQDLIEGTTFASIESSNCICPFRAPISGKLVSFNAEAVEHPERIDSETYLVKVK